MARKQAAAKPAPAEIPLNQRPGRCGNCGNGSFHLRVVAHDLHRQCKACGVTLNVDTMEVV